MLIIRLLCIALILTWNPVSAHQSAIYVSPTGKDIYPGTKDKPVNSLKYALSLSRTEHVKIIVLRKGNYYNVGVALTLQDAGLTITNYKKEKAILYGGILINRFSQEGKFLVADLPQNSLDWNIRMILVNGKIAERSRLPESGYYTMKNVWTGKVLPLSSERWSRKPTNEELTSLQYKPDDYDAWKAELLNAELSTIHEWTESYFGIESVDSLSNNLKLSEPDVVPLGTNGHYNYAIWNTKKGVAHPGQWYWEKKGNKIYYYPKADESVKEIMVAGNRNIITISKGVKNIFIKGLIFSMGSNTLQNEHFCCENIDAAIDARQTQNFHLDNVSIVNTQGNGIYVTGRDIFISNLGIDHCGGTGIYFLGNNVHITNSKFEHLGVVFKSATAIYGYGKHVSIDNCAIADTPYSGISLACDSSQISNCSVKQYMTVLQDGGAIYSSAHKFVKITNNYIEGIYNRGLAMGIYFDARSEHCEARNNVVVNSGIPVHSNITHNILFSNNLFIDKGRQRINYGGASNIQLDRNVFIADTIVCRGPSVFDKKVDTLTIEPKLRRYANPTGVSSFKNNYIFSQSAGSVKLPRIAKEAVSGTEIKYIKPNEMSTVVSGLFSNKDVRAHLDFSKMGLTSSKLKEISKLIKDANN